MTECKWLNGQSILPQARPTQTIEWEWVNGQSGDIDADEYVAVPAGAALAGGKLVGGRLTGGTLVGR